MEIQSKQAIESFLEQCNQWQLHNGKLYRELKFKDFKQAFAFMAQVAQLAEEINHHPLWVNSYSRVEIQLITTELNAITELDIKLATRIEQLL